MNQIKNILNILGFRPKNGCENIYFKKYNNIDKELIIKLVENSDGKIDKTNSKIHYKDFGIDTTRETTSNFFQNESLIILECINRLLEKGYSPENIILEKDWDLGHKRKGNLDIEVVQNNKAIFLIECKTWETEFENEKRKMLKNGGQLFTYLQQEQNAKAICLYTSRITNNEIEYKNLIVENSEKWKGLNQDERFTYWNKEFKDNGIFEEYVPLFKLESRAIRLNKLKTLDKDVGNKIYLNFLEILRHNSVSDKPNAFNKMMNLFLCKITDEQIQNDKEAEFQVKTTDKDEDILIRLNNLYNQGMKNFLNIEILDLDSNKIDKIIENIKDEKSKELAKLQFEYLRIKKSQEFNFLDIATDDDFKENTSILREIITILQEYKLRYTQKHQFLGDFFEKLLNDSLKQESGQYFTPIPICEFIINSIPLKNIIYNKIKNEDRNFLPYSIDFACGTGHFLTELMEKIQNNINKIEKEDLKTFYQEQSLNIYKGGYNNWAKEFIYGIDKDKRLIKATKISCFLNGDGDANIIAGDGLDNFYLSSTYKGKLHIDSNKQDNENFDLLISNPPYSVNAFRNYVKNNLDSFNLFEYLTDKSDEIEALFVERMKQLLKIGGIAGIILPTSLLTNSGIHEKAREIILQNFKIISIVDMGMNAFMATVTKTTILFLQKIENISKNIANDIEQFFNTKQDITSNSIEKVFSKYCNLVYKLELYDYISILDLDPTEKAREHDIYKEYTKLFNAQFEKKKIKNLDKLKYIKDEVRKTEKEKLLYFILSYNQIIVIGKSGEKEVEKSFYGYKFSDRKGQQGINIYRDNDNKIISKMFNENDLYDNNKLNSYILRNFNNDKNIKQEIKNIKENTEHELNNHIDCCSLWQTMNFENSTFDKGIRINNIKNEDDDKKLKWDLVRLGDIKYGNIIVGSTPNTRENKYWKSGNLPWATIDDFKNLYIFDTKQHITNEGAKLVQLVEKGSVLVSCTATIGKVAIAAIDLRTNQQIVAIKCNNDIILKEYFAYYLIYNKDKLLKISNKYISVEKLDANFKLPLPPKGIQEKIVSEIEVVEKQKKEKENKIKELNNKIEEILESSRNNLKEYRLGDICKNKGIVIGGTPKRNHKEYYYRGENLWLSISEMNNNVIMDTKEKINDLGVKNSNVKLIKTGTILVSFKLSIGKVAIAGKDLYTNEAIAGLVIKNEIVDNHYLFLLFKNKIVNLESQQKAFGKSLNGDSIKNIKINLPNLSIQQQTVAKIEIIEKEIEKLEEEIKNCDLEKENILNSYLYD